MDTTRIIRQAQALTIGQVARAAGVNVETIRFYQRRKLMDKPEKPLRGVRRYGRAAVDRVRFIKRAQQLGFTLEEVRGLLALQDGRSCGEARRLAAAKLESVEERIADLQRMRRVLKTLIGQCDTRRGQVACPIISTLSGVVNAEARLGE
ncbi:Hg(II)-responsive transcriptional regulator [Pelomicrobium methylotrophicum]|uniref:Mercuric resistance operon regulatory protein n=1 Tax=Pelomicrobium methylotrophicum TaxID=2602750 RepID=A0A5C7EYW1_9PROT|nr:Hg(II)-responsive transcriptional regulator [Pelomicrobium methylotrophicum]TXF12282.1 Hg(II)-responsive transcriptional regulator [Pelomicrobium methylotrophicum]